MMCNEWLDNGLAGDEIENTHEIAENFWLIQQRTPDGQLSHRYLQIGTGQWCPSQYATRFPLRRTAIVYAHEFGYSVGYTAEVVPYHPDSS